MPSCHLRGFLLLAAGARRGGSQLHSKHRFGGVEPDASVGKQGVFKALQQERCVTWLAVASSNSRVVSLGKRFFFFFADLFLTLKAGCCPRRQANCLQSYTATAARARAERGGSRAQRQAAGACRGCEPQHTLEWRSVALVGMQRGGPSPS